MRRVKKISIARYISTHFIGMTFFTALLMAIFVTYFSNAAIEYDLRSQVRRESQYDYLNIRSRKGKIKVSGNFVYNDNGIIKVILKPDGSLVAGSYPNEELAKQAVRPRFVRDVVCDGVEYYLYDRPIIKRDDTGKSDTIAYVRSMVDRSNLSSGYRTLKYASYICGVVIVAISTLVALIFSRRLTEPIKQICETSEHIGLEKDLSQRMEYDGMFQEIGILAEANNRMLDRLEEMFEQQKQFSSDVTHELRTPVSVIMAQCQYARKHIHDEKEFAEAFSLIERQVKKTNAIISQILQLSRLDQDRVRIDFEYVDLRDIVEEVCENEKLSNEKNVRLNLSMEKAEARVDVGLIMTAIRNLVDNAMKYSEENGAVDITLTKKDGQVKLMVKDYGCGMSENVKKHIFDRFYRADQARNSEGFGLGLSITARIVEIHKGKLSVESEEKKGSTFTLTLSENF